MIKKKHLSWILAVSLVFAFLDIGSSVNFMINLNLFADTKQNSIYQLSYFLFEYQSIKFHFIILTLMIDSILAGFYSVSIFFMERNPLDKKMSKLQYISRAFVIVKLIAGIIEHIQQSLTFNVDEISIYCNQSAAGQSNRACSLQFSNNLLISFIYISNFFMFASHLSFRFYYRIFVKQETFLRSRFLDQFYKQEANEAQQEQQNDLQFAAVQVQLELSEKENDESVKSSSYKSSKIKLENLYLTNQVRNPEGFETNRNSPSPKNQNTQQRMSVVRPQDQFASSFQNESPKQKIKRQASLNSSIISNPISTPKTKNEFSSTLSSPQRPFSLSLKNRKDIRMSQSQKLFESSNSSGDDSLKSCPLDLKLKKGISETISEEQDDEDPRYVPNSTFRTKQQSDIHPLSIVPSLVIAGHGAAKVTGSVLNSVFQATIGSKATTEVATVAVQPVKSTFSRMLSLFIDNNNK